MKLKDSSPHRMPILDNKGAPVNKKALDMIQPHFDKWMKSSAKNKDKDLQWYVVNEWCKQSIPEPVDKRVEIIKSKVAHKKDDSFDKLPVIGVKAASKGQAAMDSYDKLPLIGHHEGHELGHTLDPLHVFHHHGDSSTDEDMFGFGEPVKSKHVPAKTSTKPVTANFGLDDDSDEAIKIIESKMRPARKPAVDSDKVPLVIEAKRLPRNKLNPKELNPKEKVTFIESLRGGHVGAKGTAPVKTVKTESKPLAFKKPVAAPASGREGKTINPRTPTQGDSVTNWAWTRVKAHLGANVAVEDMFDQHTLTRAQEQIAHAVDEMSKPEHEKMVFGPTRDLLNVDAIFNTKNAFFSSSAKSAPSVDDKRATRRFVKFMTAAYLFERMAPQDFVEIAKQK